jgi:hypothetical protein
MEKALAFAVLACVVLAYEPSTGRAEEALKARKFIMVDTSTFKNALARAGKVESGWDLEPSVDSYGVLSTVVTRAKSATQSLSAKANQQISRLSGEWMASRGRASELGNRRT